MYRESELERDLSHSPEWLYRAVKILLDVQQGRQADGRPFLLDQTWTQMEYYWEWYTQALSETVGGRAWVPIKRDTVKAIMDDQRAKSWLISLVMHKRIQKNVPDQKSNWQQEVTYS